jgi:hypothetical protein
MRVSTRCLATLAALAIGAAVLTVGPFAVPAWAAAPAATFGPPTHFDTGTFPVSVALGDMNGDSVPDLATANLNAASVSVLLGDGAGGFGAPVDHAAGGDPRSVAVGDLNGDSFLDLAVANSAGSGGVSVLLGDGTGDFGTKTDYASGISVYPFSVALSDLDGDGVLDLALADYFSSRVSVLLGDGSGAFGPVVHIAGVGSPLGVAVGDLDGDAVPDLAVTNYSGTTVSVLLGDGLGGFGVPSAFPVGSLPDSVAIGDVDGDGSSDLAVTNAGAPFGNGTVSVLRGNGTGSFAAATNLTVGPQPSSVAMADLNSDSFVDLAVANRNGALVGDGDGSVSVVLGNGDGTFDTAVSRPTGRYSASVAVGDLDADGRRDLALATNVDSGSVAVLRNTTGTRSVAASPSTHLVDGQTITVTGSGWQPGHTIGFCQAVAADPPGAGSCADGLFTEATADAFGNISGSLVVRASINVPNLGSQIACTGPTQPCALGAADVADVAGTVTSVPLGFDLAVPGAPTIGSAVAGDGEATVSWTAPAFDGGSLVTGYVVTPYVGFSPQPSQSFSSTATSEVVTGLANFTQYRFRVQAINAIGTGAYSTASNAVIPAPAGLTVPGAPTIGAAVAGEGEATVSWTAPASDGGSPVTGYVVTPYIGYAPQPSQTFASTTTTQTLTGLANGSTYRFRLQAINVVGTGGYSTASNAVTPATVPDPPLMGSAVAGNAQATVSWTAPFDGGSPVTGYVVTPYIGAVPQTAIAFGASPTSQTITGLANGTTYTFTVAAINALGTGPASAASNPVTPQATVPGAPTIGSAIAGDRQATVSWTAPVSDGGSPITGYVVTPYIGYFPLQPRTFASTATTQVVTGLTNGTTYRFRVRAINAVGTGSYSRVTNPVTPTA